MLIPRTQHQATRPDWDCRVCGEAWPCATAKVELGEQFQMFPRGLALLLRSYLLEAIADWAAATSGLPPYLYERFLGWAGLTESNSNLIQEARMDERNEPTRLLLDVFGAPIVVRIGTTLVGVGATNRCEGRIVLDLDPGDLEAAVEQLVLDSAIAAKARAICTRDHAGAVSHGPWEASDV
ncbi:hypothetical protein Aca07nite_72030 [Actinoplanes capillaceus]|uniref:Uncharacterized protein n=1 Tax=Actinoplanes campanulatus TaxID=113559 RepID=A0ABQ3WUR6_9ACTN|nr:hypothetical protein [Actinoplanes capillaceus]GID49928.1 hypothetical protein Aca07nite_72030 [Actinoplanes capillaceus]